MPHIIFLNNTQNEHSYYNCTYNTPKAHVYHLHKILQYHYNTYIDKSQLKWGNYFNSKGLKYFWGDKMNIGEATKLRIIDLCRENKITINKLATVSGITQSTLSNIIGGRNNSTTISTIKKLCDGLNISIQEFFDSNLFDDLEQEVR